MITPKDLRQEDLRDQYNELCITKSIAAISNLVDELINCKNDKNILGNEYR